MFGRRKIFCDADVINSENIVDIITEAMQVHRKNATEIKRLRRYLAGDQPILDRTKKTRDDILNKVVVNTASEVVDFKLSYIFAAPLDIVRSANSETDIDITPFQRMMDEQDKDGVDQEIALDMLCGALGYRGVLPNPNENDVSPFSVVSMRPETTFCVYKNDVFKRKMLGASYVKKIDGTLEVSAYTKTTRFLLKGDSTEDAFKLVGESANGIGEIPIAEYAMPELVGCFEKAVPLMNALNTASSNRIDDIEQFVQSILAVFGVDLDEDALAKLKKHLCLIVPNIQEGTQPRAEYLVNSMDQTSVQSVVDDLYYHILEVCSVPGREQSSGGNTGAATEMGAGGWRKAQYSAERIIAAWQKGDREMYRIALSILERSKKTPAELKGLKPTDLQTKFTLSKSNNLLTKAQALLNLLDAGVAPRIAYREVDLFSDAEAVYEESRPYIEKMQESKKPAQDKALGAVDVTNQPKSEASLTQKVEGKGTTQKLD